ncbi:ROK family protein [Clostridium niameyense]|uniref:ROK family protein n=1 Tax=Clostridium niameyense TaxID=1622073 RepID=A0A6M0RBB9_9CLOT|nr:ROK family protein [Clostridium niameyense]NEZ47462.1 ROK family protein [Clostridium niameyense]
MVYIALDIGGTEIKYGLVNEDGFINSFYSKSTFASKGASYLLENIKSIIEELIVESKKNNRKIKAIGISTAGQVNSDTGEIIFATEAIPGWTGVKLKSIIEEEFNYPCTVENDVNCAALGEMWQGAAKREKNFLCLTLGTGIGGAIIIDGKVFTGNSYSAGEFGHITLYPNGEQCNCGQRGCFERYASTSALVNRAKKILIKDNYNNIDIDNINGKFIFEKAQNGEKIYLDIIDKWTYDIALGLKTLVHIFNPSLILIGGGVSAQKEFLTDRISNHLSKMIMPSFNKNLKIKTAECGNKAGILGAINKISN